MDSPTFSIVIPVSQKLTSLTDTIPSILQQTYANFEVIIVHCSKVHVQHPTDLLADPRIRCIQLEGGANFLDAVHTGIRAASGDFLTILDGNTSLDPDKLQAHMAFFAQNSDISATYNTRIEHDSSGLPLSLWAASQEITLLEGVLNPSVLLSDIVFRKEWAAHLDACEVNRHDKGGWIFSCEQANLVSGLALAGCKFAHLEPALNARRGHSPQLHPNLLEEVESTICALESIFADPRCPLNVLAIRERALSKRYLIGSYLAFAQDDTALGQVLMRQSVRLDRSILDRNATKFIEFLVLRTVCEEYEYESLFHRLFAQFPEEFSWINKFYDRAVSNTYLYRGALDAIWGRLDGAYECLAKIAPWQGGLETRYLYTLQEQIVRYEATFGVKPAKVALNNLFRYLKKSNSRKAAHWFTGTYFASQAFQNYHRGHFDAVARNVLHAFTSSSIYLIDSGMWSILLRSSFQSSNISR